MVPLSRNTVHLAFDYMLNYLNVYGQKNGVLTMERISLDLRMFAKLVKRLTVQMERI